MRLNVFGLVVADMPRALAFYRRLGLDVPEAEDKSPHVEHVLDGGVKLCWDTVETVRSFMPEWSAPTGGSRIGLAFECSSPAEVDRVYGELAAAGHDGHKAPWDAFWGQRYAVLHDPDGNSVELYAAL
ncbi:VOC family protein [Dactylosporangium sp. CS-033363]|uniref:VOC family protein n=1 Tax=Dactylosporangium sp. CS-033363 TaxID=3239935 RepID=UPI003D94E198